MKRLLAVLGALLMLGALAALGVGAAPPPPAHTLTANGQNPNPQAAAQVRHPDEVSRAVKSDVMSVPLRDIPAVVSSPNRQEEDNENPPIRDLKSGNGIVDKVLQSVMGPLAMPTTIANFEGQYNQNGPLPPDTNGDVGRNHYVQIVNSTFEVYTKSGTSVYGPANNSTLFRDFGGPCETHNDGDPVALYDAMADRWVLTWFTSSAPYMECVAVSTSPDPTGTWYRYAFLDHNSGNTLGDYPKMSVWPDAYYMTTNEFGAPSGGGNYAYDRAKMLRGDPTATYQYFHITDQGLLPSDLDGPNLPPSGSPAFFLEWFDTSHLAEYKFHVDWTTPANSTFTGPFQISVASFNPNAPSVPEPGTSTHLDNLSDRLMYRLAYRNFGDHESLVVNHTVVANSIDGIRWYELRDPNGAGGATVYQQGTYGPNDGLYRWMGSAAMDGAGDIAVGFSGSSTTVYPSILYAGRLSTDPLGQLSQGEATLHAGTGSEDYPAAHRWGDYSAMQVDPVDDCTFWYTTLYWAQTGERNWRTRIGSFKFPQCPALGTPTPVATDTPGPSVTPLPPTPTVCADSSSYTDSITTAEPTQVGRLGLFDPKSTCDAPKTVSGQSDNLTRHYRSYTYTNTSGSPLCVTVYLNQECGDNAVQSITYLNTFDPNNISSNYLADGGSAGPTSQYSFSLGAGQTAVVVVVEVSPNIGCTTYTLTISPCAPGGATHTPTSTVQPSATATSTAVSTTTAVSGSPTETSTAVTGTTTPVATGTPTTCTMSFTDVSSSDWFYDYVYYLFCHGVISGYNTSPPCAPDAIPCFNPSGTTTRGQLSKIAVLGFNVPINTSGGPHFIDVLPGSTFYDYIETLVNLGAISGYDDHTFRPNNWVTRGQLTKIVVNTAVLLGRPGWHLVHPTNNTFEDVLPDNPFYDYIETAFTNGVIGGYPCGTPPAGPCVPPDNKPYFLPFGNATRAQISKIAFLAITYTPPAGKPANK